MDAVVCAQTLRWRDSAAFDESLSLSLEPSEVYELNRPGLHRRHPRQARASAFRTL